jgi:hypothetical protein
MQSPDCVVSRQFPENRTIQLGDVAFCEISGSFRVTPPRATYVRWAPARCRSIAIYFAAEAAFDAVAAVLQLGTTMEKIVEVSGVIEKAGFTTCDDLVHGRRRLLPAGNR